MLAARNLDRLEWLGEELRGRYPGLKVAVLAADLSAEHEAERLLAKVSERAGAVDVLINNAGLGDSVLFDRAGVDTDPAKPADQNICRGPAYLGIGAWHGGAPPRRSAQHRVGRGPDGLAKRGCVRREQALRGRIQPSAAH